VGEKKVNSAQQYLVEEELEYYRDGYISRREFMRRAGLFGVGAVTAAAMAAMVTPTSQVRASTAQRSPFSVPEGDPAVATDWIWYTSNDGVPLKAYLAWPAWATEADSLPGVAVCHENRGINPHIQDVARRFARQGYVAIAPDLPSRTGTPTDQFADVSELMAAYRQLTPEQNSLDFRAALEYLQAHPVVDAGRLAATGYCFGGGVIWRLATVAEMLTAAAPFYGSAPPASEVPNIRAAVLGVYAGLDERVNASIPALDEQLTASGVVHRMNVYPNAGHGFHNDTGNIYHPEMAAQAWMDTLNWFAEHLGLPAPTF
jgi:carboxymethylenebutenolidase